MNYDQRKIVVENIKFVDKVIPQYTMDYSDNLKKLKPDFVVHGDDWKTGIQKNSRSNVIKVLKKWSGKLVETKYTKNISSSKIKAKFMEIGTTPEIRKSKLSRMITSKEIVRILECHTPLTGLIIEKLNYVKKNRFSEFDGMWSSSLTDSALRGKPDNQSVDYSTRINSLNEITEVTTKPIIFDGDNGGRIEHIPYLVKSLEKAGVSALVIEDKIGLKKKFIVQKAKKYKTRYY